VSYALSHAQLRVLKTSADGKSTVTPTAVVPNRRTSTRTQTVNLEDATQFSGTDCLARVGLDGIEPLLGDEWLMLNSTLDANSFFD
jgi:hypothetical protein